MTDSAPQVQKLEATVPAATKEATQDQVIGEAPFAGVVSSASIIPEANGTANATNNRTFKIVNKGQSGSGTTAAATFATDTVTTDDLKAFDEKALPLSATPADLVVAAGDIIAVVETVAAEGLAHSGYRVEVELSRS